MHPDGQRELHWRELDHLVWDTSRLTTSLISQRYQVKPKRAETLLPGAVLFRSLMERLSVTTMEVSAYGVREGAIAEMLEGRLTPVLT
jgi:exopolyphosphatase/guanosine-5'-triphosphate,3'-diphosphate pyrophosphatase